MFSGGGCHAVGFVAADATNGFAGFNVDVIAHPFDFQVVFIEGFKQEEFVGWELEVRGAVVFDGDGAEDFAGIPAGVDSDVAAAWQCVLCFCCDFDDAQVFGFAPFDTFTE